MREGQDLPMLVEGDSEASTTTKKRKWAMLIEEAFLGKFKNIKKGMAEGFAPK
jgi:hypothetical protein